MMNDYLENIFYIPLLHLSVRDWENKKKILLEVIKNNPIKPSDDENILTNYHQHKGDLNETIERLFEEEIKSFCECFGFVYYRVSMSWFQIAEKGHHHGVHNHGSTGYSSVCYLEYDEDVHTPTEFIAPFNNFITGEGLYHSPKVSEGSIIFFPSNLMHFTDINKSDKKRVIISFNIDVRESHDQRPRYS